MELLKELGKIAGIAGIGVGVFLLVVQKALTQNRLKQLNGQQSFKFLRLTIILTWSIAIFGIIGWLYSEIKTKSSQNLLEPLDNTGWIFLGYYDFKENKYIESNFSFAKSPYSDASPIPRKGEIFRIEKERNVIIVDYKITGLQRKFDAPLSDLEDKDFTKIKLSTGTEVIVRDISIAQYPGQPSAVWVRIGL